MVDKFRRAAFLVEGNVLGVHMRDKLIFITVTCLLLQGKAAFAACSIGSERWFPAIQNLSVDARWNQSEKNSAKFDAPPGYVVLQTRVNEQSNHWGSASVSVLRGGSKFATSSDFESAHDYALEMYGKYADKTSKKEVEAKLRQAMQSKSKYSREFSSNTNMVYAEVAAHGSGNFWDQQGGWMVISVEALLLCVGEPDRVQLAEQIISASSLPNIQDVHTIRILNDCDKNVSLALRYKDVLGKWQQAYWYRLKAGESSAFNNEGQTVSTKEKSFFYFAKAGEKSWQGKDASSPIITVDGKVFKMRQTKSTSLRLTCRNE